MVRSRYSRQLLLWPRGEESQSRLHRSTVLILGCGALGSRSAEELARSGVGTLRVVDRDVVDWSNLHRQTGYEEADAAEGLPKSEALARRLFRVNSEVKVESHSSDFAPENALSLARGCDLLLDGSDNLPARFLLNDLSLRAGIPWVYAGAIGTRAHVQFFSGTRGPCLRCTLPEPPPPASIETCDTSGILGPTAGLAASWQASLALAYLSGREATSLDGRRVLLDPWTFQARISSVAADPQCPACASRHFEALAGRFADTATELCGRDAIQVRPRDRPAGPVDLEALASRLASIGEVERRRRYLRVRAPEGYSLTLFEDGRAVFDGLTDPVQARSLYARLVGR